MATAAELKHIFQDGWNRPDRVENYVRNVAHGEFEDAASLRAWRECLEPRPGGRRPAHDPQRGNRPGRLRLPVYADGTRLHGAGLLPADVAGGPRPRGGLGVGLRVRLRRCRRAAFQPETFDIISSRHLLFNLPHPGLAVRRWVRLLKPGGRMILIGDAAGGGHRSPRSIADVRSNLDSSLARLRGNNRPGWRPTADYMKAVSQCPLFRHSAGAIRRLMEAAGARQHPRIRPTPSMPPAGENVRRPGAAFPGRTAVSAGRKQKYALAPGGRGRIRTRKIITCLCCGKGVIVILSEAKDIARPQILGQILR